jgi:hypothetical protein
MTTCNRLLDVAVHVVHSDSLRCDCGETESGWIPAVPIYDGHGNNLTRNLLVPKPMDLECEKRLIEGGA